MRKNQYIQLLKKKIKKDQKRLKLLESLPEFIKLNGIHCAMRLDLENMEYWRDAGLWGLPFRFRNSILVGKATYLEIKHLSGIMLEECTYEEWKKDNGWYAPELNENIINENITNDLPF